MSIIKNEKTWVEKYRPKTINSIVQQDEIKYIIQYTYNNNSMPHLLFFGPAGVGKTTAALAITKHFFIDNTKSIEYNRKIMEERVLELNASDERGIKFVRENIKNFAQITLQKRSNLPNFKIIILDEADAMTSDSQFALRMIIEKYSKTTRFILICNYVTKMIHPLISRTMKLRYKSITLTSMEQVINKIARKENINIYKDFIVKLKEITKGDLRRAINLLERVNFIDSSMSIKTLEEVSGLIDSDFMNKIIKIIMNKQSTTQDLFRLVNEFKNQSYSSLILLENIFNHVINLNISEKTKSSLISIISNIDNELNNNADETIQLLYLFNIINFSV